MAILKGFTGLTVFTSYRPSFCCECGNKIVRLRWFVWTSRRFCDKCARTFTRSHWLQPSLTILALVVVGVLIGRGCRRAPQPLIIERSPIRPVQNATSTTSNAPQPAPTIEQVYMCGARTKKGKPCSRRVHGPVRCWQHKGEPAMAPLEKLLIKEK